MLHLVAGRMLELHLRELRGDGVGRVHIAERGGEDDVTARQRHLGQHPLGVGALGHILLKRGLDLVAELLDHRPPSKLVLIGPAAVADRADIDEAGLNLVLSEGGPAKQQPEAERRAGEKSST